VVFAKVNMDCKFVKTKKNEEKINTGYALISLRKQKILLLSKKAGWLASKQKITFIYRLCEAF
jgi:hypothetical protein